MSKQRVLQDHYFKLAKEEGYLARSAYKLKQILEKYPVAKRGHAVLDLGCAPGAWVQVLLETVGKRGVVVGVDLKEVPQTLGPNAVTVVGDVREVEAGVLLEPIRGEGRGDRLFDAVVSDMAPDTGGAGDADRSAHLCRDAVRRLPELLRANGSIAMKVLEGGEYPVLLEEVRGMFAFAKGFKPKASRDVSKEMYIVGERFRPGRAPVGDARKKLPPHLRFRESDFRAG